MNHEMTALFCYHETDSIYSVCPLEPTKVSFLSFLSKQKQVYHTYTQGGTDSAHMQVYPKYNAGTVAFCG